MADTLTYAEKLKDARWQKKRLEILQRDEFTCRFCYDAKSTLHVHHLKYCGDPWEVGNDFLITICESCHKDETVNRSGPEQRLIKALRIHGFRKDDIITLAEGFEEMPSFHLVDVEAYVISKIIKDGEKLSLLADQVLSSKKNENNVSIDDAF